MINIVLLITAGAVVFATGVLCGRHQKVQRAVDAALRRETRFRHPTMIADPLAAMMAGAMALGKCGKPVRTSLGRAVCLKSCGHQESCQ